MLVCFFLGIEITHRRTPFYRPFLVDRAGAVQQGFDQCRLACPALSGYGNISNVFSCIGHYLPLLYFVIVPLKIQHDSITFINGAGLKSGP